MDIGGWLRSLGLEQYEAAFRENEIDGEVLPKLTAEDLKDLGVAIVGHRRKILVGHRGTTRRGSVGRPGRTPPVRRNRRPPPAPNAASSP